MSWDSEDLPAVGWDDGSVWSVADAAWLLELPVRRVRAALRAGEIEAIGKRHERGRSTRHVRVYRAEDVLRVLGIALAEKSLEL